MQNTADILEQEGLIRICNETSFASVTVTRTQSHHHNVELIKKLQQ